MKKILFLILFTSISTYAFAQVSARDIANSCGVAQTCGTKIATIGQNQSLIPATDNAIDLGSSSKEYRSAYIGTSVVVKASGSVTMGANSTVSYASGAQPKFIAAAVITPETGVPTPAAGNTLSERHTILAAGAPTAAFVVLPVATSSVGKVFKIWNQGSNPLAIVPQTGVINVSGALTPFSCTTLKECTCTGLTTGVFGCSQQ